MKKLMFISLFMLAALLPAMNAHSQVHINISIGDQPEWAPTGFDDAQYYYIPDCDMYYDVSARQFLYLSNRHWVRSSTLPAQYRKYDLYKLHKVAINKPNAYKYHKQDKAQYAQFRGKYDQTAIRDSHDDRYKNNHNNWSNNRFKKGHDDRNHHH